MQVGDLCVRKDFERTDTVGFTSGGEGSCPRDVIFKLVVGFL